MPVDDYTPWMDSDNAKRYNEGKPKLSFVLDFQEAIALVSQVSEFGAHKYGRYNWQKGLPYTSVSDSLLRHLTAFQNGEDNDPESGLPHTAHIAWNALALAEFFVKNPEKDDRAYETDQN